MNGFAPLWALLAAVPWHAHRKRFYYRVPDGGYATSERSDCSFHCEERFRRSRPSDATMPFPPLPTETEDAVLPLPRTPAPKTPGGSFEFPPLFIPSDPLANVLLSQHQQQSAEVLSQDALRGLSRVERDAHRDDRALVVRQRRQPRHALRLSRHPRLGPLHAGWRSGGGRPLFDKQLDKKGNGTTSVGALLDYVMGLAGVKRRERKPNKKKKPKDTSLPPLGNYSPGRATVGRARVGAPRGAKHATLGPSASAPVLPVMRVDDPAASPEPTGGTSSQEQRDLEQIGHIANFAADPALMAALDLDERAVVARAREVTLQSQQQSPVQKSPGTDHGSPASTRIPILKSSDSFKLSESPHRSPPKQRSPESGVAADERARHRRVDRAEPGPARLGQEEAKALLAAAERLGARAPKPAAQACRGGRRSRRGCATRAPIRLARRCGRASTIARRLPPRLGTRPPLLPPNGCVRGSSSVRLPLQLLLLLLPRCRRAQGGRERSSTSRRQLALCHRRGQIARSRRGRSRRCSDLLLMPTAPAPAAAPPKPAAKAAAKAAAPHPAKQPSKQPSSSRSAKQPASSRSTERRQGLLRSSWGSFAKGPQPGKPLRLAERQAGHQEV